MYINAANDGGKKFMDTPLKTTANLVGLFVQEVQNLISEMMDKKTITKFILTPGEDSRYRDFSYTSNILKNR